MTSVLIKNAFIATADDEQPIIREGSIYVEDDRIVEIGKKVESKSAEFVIDGKDRIVLPGLVNTHVHLAQASSEALCRTT
jgi:Cytosine deaminase and related metal-dependent hydrolases